MLLILKALQINHYYFCIKYWERERINKYIKGEISFIEKDGGWDKNDIYNIH